MLAQETAPDTFASRPRKPGDKPPWCGSSLASRLSVIVLIAKNMLLPWLKRSSAALASCRSVHRSASHRMLCPLSRRLAAFEACSGCPLTRLELTKSVPLTEATAQAIDAWCPQLHSLCVVQTTYPQYYVDDDVEDAEAEYLVACEQLLLRCGPRLRSLKLHGVHGWDESCFMAVRHCTALTELDLEVRWMESQPTEISEELHVGTWICSARFLRWQARLVRCVRYRMVSRLAKGATGRVAGRGVRWRPAAWPCRCAGGHGSCVEGTTGAKDPSKR